MFQSVSHNPSSLCNHIVWFCIFLDILVATPNRLVHMLQQDPPAIQLDSVEWLILDEADKLFEDGKDGFRDQVGRKIIKACEQRCSQPQTSGGPIVQLAWGMVPQKRFLF